MAEPRDTANAPAESGPHCCGRHEDWAALAEHLLQEFPEVTISTVVREIGRAKTAVEETGLQTTEALQTGEAIVRHQLLFLVARGSGA